MLDGNGDEGFAALDDGDALVGFGGHENSNWGYCPFNCFARLHGYQFSENGLTQVRAQTGFVD
jgi:hypothetical protein